MTPASETSHEAPGLRVGILGCGALGGVLAARLASRDGVVLEVYNTNGAIARAVERDGLVLVEGSRRSSVPLPLLAGPSAAGDGVPLDLIILATKSVGLLEAARRLAPALAQDGVFVTTQNGLVAADLAKALSPQRIVAGAVLWGASMDAPGVYRVTAHGPFVLGRLWASGELSAAATSAPLRPALRAPGRAAPPSGRDDPLERSAALLGEAFPVRLTENMTGVLWSKLAITASLTTLGAITGLRFGEMVRRRRTRSILLGLGAEVVAVARCREVCLEPLGGGLNVEPFLSPTGYPVPLKHLLMRVVGSRHRRTESSMLDSLRRGRRTEIQFINGRVVELAEAAGVPCPLNRTAVELVREMEEGRSTPSVDHLGRFTVG
jgi:2-dehydropantoate 2-reductase